MTAIHSQKYLAGSRDATCKFRIPDICTNRNVVPCHIRDRHTGRGIKASDLSVGDGCQDCHDVFDRRRKMPDGFFITDAEWLFYALRGLQDTLEGRHEKGLLVVPEDATKTFHERKARPRKPPEQRKKVAQGRPLQSRPSKPAKPQHTATRPLVRKSERVSP